MKSFRHIQHETCQIKNLAKLYDQYFADKDDGVFVDVGAYDGKNWSNVWGLAQVGWSGLAIEPIPFLVEQCKSNLGEKVTVIQGCVGDRYRSDLLFLDPNGVSHTLDEETVETNPFGFKYDRKKHTRVQVYTLNFLIPEYLKRLDVDVLSIDVEGAELQVLAGLDFGMINPRMVIIETHKGNEDRKRDQHSTAIHKIMTANLFAEIQCDTLNSIYWRD
jgi:FkbM family methyltransferase